MKARKGEEGWRGRVTRTGESPLTKRRPRNTIRESNHRMKGMKGVSQIKSARSTAETKKGSRISLPLGRRTRSRDSETLLRRDGDATDRYAARGRANGRSYGTSGQSPRYRLYSPGNISDSRLRPRRVRSRNQLFNKWNPGSRPPNHHQPHRIISDTFWIIHD